MLYYLFDYLDKHYDLMGAGLFQYISFRAGAAAVLSLIITITLGKALIAFLRRKQVGEDIRDLGLEGQLQKRGTTTMGGLIIIGAILVPTVLLARLDNVYIILLVLTTVWLGLIGLLDDYIKVFKKDKEGLAGWFKIIGQVGLGIVVVLVLFFNQNVVVRNVLPLAKSEPVAVSQAEEVRNYQDVKSTKTTVPFFKNNELDYSALVPARQLHMDHLRADSGAGGYGHFKWR